MFLCSLRYCLKFYFSKGVYSFTLSTVHGLFIYTLITMDSRASNKVSQDSCMSLTVIVFTSTTIVIHQNFTGKILVCFIQPIQTSPDFIFLRIKGYVCSDQSLHKLRVTYDNESTLVLALPEPIEIALQ